MALKRSRPLRFAALVATASLTWCSAHAGAINSNVAFTPRKGGTVFRLQYHYAELSGGNIAQVHRSGVRSTFVHGISSKLAIIFSAPYVNRQVDRVVPRFGRVEEAHDGIGDITLMGKYRFWQHDPRPLETWRWAALGGINIRSGDSHFSSDSYDPVLGTVFSWQRDRHHIDADLIYQINTGRSEYRHDALRYDLAYSYRLFPAVYDAERPYEVNAVAELNGRYVVDGSHEVFLSPGLQFIAQRWAIEASVQLPVVQEFADSRPQTDYRVVVGLRFRW